LLTDEVDVFEGLSEHVLPQSAALATVGLASIIF